MTKYKNINNSGDEAAENPDRVKYKYAETSSHGSQSSAGEEVSADGEPQFLNAAAMPLEITILACVFIGAYIAIGYLISQRTAEESVGGEGIIWTFTLQFFIASFILILVLCLSHSKGNQLNLITCKRFIIFAFLVLISSNPVIVPIAVALLLSILCYSLYFDGRSREAIPLVSKLKGKIEYVVKDSVVKNVNNVAEEVISREGERLKRQIEDTVKKQIQTGVKDMIVRGIH